MKITEKFKLSTLSLALALAMSGCSGDSDKTKDKIIDEDSDNPTIISEILASNTSRQDPDFGEFGDWIELRNTTSTTLDLSGYGLSDTDKEIKWLFPNGTTINQGDYLIVWADKKNKNVSALHTNFKLNAQKDSVVLFDANSNLLQEIKFKDQRENISFAINDNGEFIRTTPTFKAKNQADAKTVSKKPTLSPPQGVYENYQDVTISSENGASIYYTTDGSKPTTSSQTYIQPIQIAENTTVKSITKEDGYDKLISKIKTSTYVIANSDIVINEILADNNSTNVNPSGKYGDWIELYNKGNNPISLNGYGLSDGKKGAKWFFPSSTNIEAGEYILVWADDENSTTSLHTNFKLSANEDTVALYDTGGKLIDFIEFKNQEKDKSLSRKGANDFIKTTPTPKAENN